MRATIRQVAAKAQVSKSTVSNVLQGRTDLVAPATYEAVLQTMHELNYVPVRGVFQNRQTATNVIGVVTKHELLVSNPDTVSIFGGLYSASAEHNYDLLIFLRSETNWVLRGEEMRYLDKRSDGLIFAHDTSTVKDELLALLAEHQVPVVLCFRRNVPENAAWVDPDSESAMNGAVEYLVQRGHRRIAHLAGATDVYDSSVRIHVFREAMMRYGLGQYSDQVYPVVDWSSPEMAFEAVLGTGATAVVCFNDGLAIDLWDYAATKGIRVPDDLSLIGIDNITAAAARGLTTWGFSYSDVGQLAVEAMVDMLHKKPNSECHRVVPVSFYERNSVRDI